MSTQLRHIAHAIVTSAEFQQRVAEVMVEMMNKTLHDAAGGRVYIAKHGSRDDLAARDATIRTQFCGNNFPQLAEQYGLTERQVRRIVARKL